MRRVSHKELLKQYPLVFVRWRDSCQREGWAEPDPDGEPMEIISVGQLMAQTKEAIHLVSHRNTEDTIHSCDFTIPKCCILEMRRLAGGKWKLASLRR